ncbi:MAG TPA: GNA1162 family protein [Candidatus Krumholzibacteria bacterium]|nr:GNA1162 family protein [Candidatus Krumholzibacteria bacterium]
MSRIAFKTGSRRAPSGLIAAALAAAMLWGCAGAPASFRANVDGVQPGDTVAVLPLVNLSQQQNAPDVVFNAVFVELLEIADYAVVDPGLVQDMVLRLRLRLTDRLPLETLQQIGQELGCRYVLEGTVNAYGMVNDGPDAYPSVAVTMRMVRCADGRIVWAGSHARRGDDTETVFGMGRVGTLEQLAQTTVSELMQSLRNEKQQGAAQ